MSRLVTSYRLPWLLLVALIALVVNGALAQSGSSAPAARRPDPLDANAPVPAVTYQSSFRAYRSFGDERVGDWQAANDTVGRIGGWRVYAREADAPEVNVPRLAPTAPAAPATDVTQPKPDPAPAPAPAGATGHKHH
jgi:hypothetical protein